MTSTLPGPRTPHSYFRTSEAQQQGMGTQGILHAVRIVYYIKYHVMNWNDWNVSFFIIYTPQSIVLQSMPSHNSQSKRYRMCILFHSSKIYIFLVWLLLLWCVSECAFCERY